MLHLNLKLIFFDFICIMCYNVYKLESQVKNQKRSVNMKKRNQTRLSIIIGTAAVAVLVTVAVLRQDLLSKPWVSWPLVAIIAFQLGSSLQKVLNKSIIQQLSCSRNQLKRQNAALTAECNKLKILINEYRVKESARNIMSTAKDFNSTDSTDNVNGISLSLEEIPKAEDEEETETEAETADDENEEFIN